MKVMIALMSSLLGAALSAPAARAQEDCIVGSWKTDGNGMAEWMREKLPANVRMPVVERTGYVTFQPDGRFAAAASLAASLETDDAVITGGDTSGLGYSGTGTWQMTAEGKLQLSTSAEVHGNQVTVHSSGGSNSVPVPPMTPGGPMIYDVSCDGDHMETRMTIRGAGAPIVQRYLRVRS